jgi:ATP-binding cassette subfamily B protein/subfamily B ATP-binding cassette protein MsbA
MKAFWNMLRRYVSPYSKYLGGSVLMNVLSAVFNIFSFALIIPVLRIIFQMDDTVY